MIRQLVKNIYPFGRDIAAVIGLFLVGWLLIGFYLNYQYLATGYDDWLYHAFKVKSLSQHGLTSWDYIWANGISHWRAYQYLPHIFTNALANLLNLTIPKALLAAVVITFIGTRLLSYIVMRLLKIPALFSFLATLVSYTLTQQWQAIRDFSIFVASLFIPIYVLAWQKSLTHKKLLFLVSALTGISWTLHPVLGFTLTGLFGLSLLSKLKSLSKKAVAGLGGIFLLASAPFSIPVLTTVYRFTNPILSSTAFLKSTLPYDYLGLGLIYTALVALGLTLLFLKGNKLTHWSKLIFLFSTLMLGLIWLGKQAYTPAVINQFQFSRSVTVLGFLLSFAFASVFASVFKRVKTTAFRSLLSLIAALAITASIQAASNYSAEPVNQIDSPVTTYFQNSTPEGAVFYHNDSQAAFFAPEGLKLVGSYNDHLLPSPLSLRFKNLLKPNIAYTGVSSKQIKLIEAYSKVLGVKYLFLPSKSSLVAALSTGTETDPRLFTLDQSVTANKETYSVLVSTSPAYQAYLISANSDVVSTTQLPLPTLQANSYSPWDDQVIALAAAIDSGALTPLNLDFPAIDQLSFTLDQPQPGSSILLTQSYDPDWSAANSSLAIEPSSLRFLKLTLPGDSTATTITLDHSWPNWYWPVQFLGLFTLIATTYTLITFQLLTALKSKTLPKPRFNFNWTLNPKPAWSTLKNINSLLTSLL